VFVKKNAEPGHKLPAAPRSITEATTEQKIEGKADPQSPPTKSPGLQPVPSNAAAASSANSSVQAQNASRGNAPTARNEADEFGIPEVLGEMAVATVNSGDRRRELRPNQIGEFPRVAASTKENIPIAVYYPEGQPNQEVAVVVQDGGRIDESVLSRVLRLNSDRSIAFNFLTGENDGLYRVSLRKGTDHKTFTVRVGPELKLKSAE
jgi:hypothetical protein